MTSTRRLWIYGSLLLLSALGVGGLAIGLLAREQERIAAREQSARDARAAAVADRARIIAENIELLVGDAQNALMTTLGEAPADEPRPFLTEWQTYNPLVREVFRSTAAGRPVWGAGGTVTREWLATTPWRGEGVSQVEAFAGLGQQTEPRPVMAVQQMDTVVAAASAPTPEVQMQNRAEISQNVVQYQNARRSLEEVAKVKSAPAAKSVAPSSSSYGLFSSLVSSAGTSSARAQAADADIAVSDSRVAAQEAPQSAAPAPAAVGIGGALPEAEQLAFGKEAKTVAAAAVVAPAVAETPTPSAIARSGWSWSQAGDGPHRFGWRELPDGTVIGLELRLEAIKTRLRELFPVASEPSGEAYVLLDPAGRAWEGREGNVSAVALLTVPLSAEVLPGWTVAAYLDDLRYASAADGGFLVAGTALVALLVGAILLSGALLLWQARRSELEAAQKTSFVANVSHEFKTPLTTIRLYSELLAEGRVRDEGKRADYLRTIGGETQRLARLVGNVLDFSRLEQGRKKFERSSLDLAAELRALLETQAPRLAEAGLTLSTDVPDVPCELTTDRDAVQQIVLNLLDNACKYAAEGREVSVKLTCGADGATVRVGDRGPGVPSSQRERIFEKFHRLDDRLTAAHAGTGLGLSIARQLARGLGGDLRCVARDGGGAEFVLTLANHSA